MAAVTSCESTLYLGCDDAAQFWESVSVKVKLLSYSLTFIVFCCVNVGTAKAELKQQISYA